MNGAQARARHQSGCVQLDKRRNVWVFRWREDGKRKTARLGTLAELPSKAKAMRAAERQRLDLNINYENVTTTSLTFEAVARKYMAERMPSRYTTSEGYRNNLLKHAISKRGSMELTAIKPIAIDRWFRVLEFSSETKAHIRSVMRQVFEYAMLCELYDVQGNPMDLVKIKGSTKRRRRSIIHSP